MGYNVQTGKPKGTIPSMIWPTLRPFLCSMVCLGIFVVGSGQFPLLDPNDPQNTTPVLINDEMLAKPFYLRFGYAWLALFFVRYKYYFAWINAEGAQNVWYAGFEGFHQETGEPLGWEVSNNIDVVAFETAPNLKTLSAAWNKKTANWLSKYVYIRTGGSLATTYGMSAFWHGFYPGYYLFFLSIPIMAQCERIGRKKNIPLLCRSRDRQARSEMEFVRSNVYHRDVDLCGILSPILPTVSIRLEHQMLAIILLFGTYRVYCLLWYCEHLPDTTQKKKRKPRKRRNTQHMNLIIQLIARACKRYGSDQSNFIARKNRKRDLNNV